MRPKRKRLLFLDFWKFLAIIAMVVFHFFWNLDYLGFYRLEPYSIPYVFFQQFSATSFLFLLGFLLYYKFEVSFKKDIKSFAKYSVRKAVLIGSFAFSITFASYLLFPEQYIYFGMLHLMAFVSFFAFVFVSFIEFFVVFAFFLSFVDGFVFSLENLNIKELAFAGFSYAKESLDFYPVVPWAFFALLGMLAAKKMLASKSIVNTFEKIAEKALSKDIFKEIVVKASKNSLLIYLLHQPILFSVMYVAKIVLYADVLRV